MTLTRWKLLAGVFGISMIGVVAMANPQCPGKPDVTREKAPPTREVAFKTGDTPKTYAVTLPGPEKAADPLPKPTTVGDVPASLPKAEFAPTIPSVTASPQIELPVISTPNALPSVQLPTPTSDRVVELPLPGVVATKPSLPVPELRVELPKVDPLVLPTPSPSSFPSPIVRAETPVRPSSPPPIPSAIVPVPTEISIPPTTNARLIPLDSPLSPVPAVEPTRAVPAIKEEVETRVRVVVPLGKSQAKFDVMAGDAVLLQAVCEQVEVRSPSEKGGPVSPIKASGKVRFTAPGCEGTCDSLAVLPSTGEVELTGSVRVTCKHGKAETEIQATTMKFKLGSAPAMAVPGPAISTVGAR